MRQIMSRATKFWIGYLVFWLALAAAVGIFWLTWFPYLIYFAVPFIGIGAIGVIPASFALFWIRLDSRSRRIALAVAYAAALIALFAAGPLYRAAHEAPGDLGPYLSWTGDPTTTMTVSWTTAEATPSRVEFAPAGHSDFEMLSDSPLTQFHHLTIEGLSPGSEYTYRVPDLGPSQYTFQTAPGGPADFAFVAYGDTRPWGGLTRHKAVVRAIRRADALADYSFVINTGDIVENPGEGYGWQWRLFLKQIIPLAATRPYLISLGNHEARGTTDYYVNYLDFGPNDFWYSFDYGGVHFVFLSTQHDLGPGSEQHQWLLADLEARPDDTRFTIACFHKPLLTYHPREHPKNDERRAALLPVFEQYGVDLVFAGHAHDYEHHRLGSVHHVVTGGGGVLLWDKATAGPETVATETCFHFCEVRVYRDAVRVRANRSDGSLIEEFQLPLQSAGAGGQATG